MWGESFLKQWSHAKDGHRNIIFYHKYVTFLGLAYVFSLHIRMALHVCQATASTFNKFSIQTGSSQILEHMLSSHKSSNHLHTQTYAHNKITSYM
jgi:hypothetical protein